MNTIYVTDTGRVMVTEDGNVKPFNSSREGISNIFRLKEDTKIIYERGETSTTLDAKAGDIVVLFYEKKFPNPIIVVENKEWSDNIIAYEDFEQKQKEEWAKKCEECDQCESCCPGC